jgi:hypothetical protein
MWMANSSNVTAMKLTQEARQRFKGAAIYSPKPTAEHLHERREMAHWNAQRGIWFTKKALECANSNEQREKARSGA